MGKKVLIADSDSVVQQVASYFLKLEGYHVEAVQDGAAAMEAVEKVAPDVIIVNPVLPGINGIEVSQFIRENPQYNTIPIVFLAESEEPTLNNIPDLSRTFGVVNKPIDPTKLVNTIKEYLEKESDPEDDVMESLKSVEELLGWEISDSKVVQPEEEIPLEKAKKGSFDITEMLGEIMDPPAEEASKQVSCADMDDMKEADSGESSMIGSMSQTMDDKKTQEQVLADMACVDGKDGMDSMSMIDGKEEYPEFMSVSQTISESTVSENDEADNIEADLKNRITDEMIENMVRKIAVDIVERVTSEILPDIAEREIRREIERLKGIG